MFEPFMYIESEGFSDRNILLDTCCCTKSQWQKMCDYLRAVLTQKTRFVHKEFI